MSESKSDREWRSLEFRGSAFSAADLRLLANMYSDPLIKAIRNDVFAFRSPVWSDGARQVLVLLGERWSDTVAMAVSKGRLCFAETLEWSEGLQAVNSIFALERRPHLFRVAPSVSWATFTEPQLTRGFAYFLNAFKRDTRIARVCALLKALGAAELSKDMSEVTVTAEARTSANKRIDLLIKWQDSSGQYYAAAIEAKLGHHVTSGQLPAYRNHLRRVAKERRLLVVVSPRLTSRTERSLQRNRDWYWTAWHDLLVAYERALAGEYDENEYVQYRRTLWNQTG